jgi:hypothetical protein
MACGTFDDETDDTEARRGNLALERMDAARNERRGGGSMPLICITTTSAPEGLTPNVEIKGGNPAPPV